MLKLELNKLYWSLTIIICLISACQKSNIVVNAEKLESKDILNAKYSEHELNTIDIYLPADRTTETAIILFVHGGFWYEGDKSMLTELAKYYRNQGYVTANLNYRLAHNAENNVHPAQINDIGKAIGYLNSKAQEYEYSPSKMALLGASAGAHLALLYSFQKDPQQHIKAVVSLAGPTNFTNLQTVSFLQSQVLEWFIGSSYQNNPSAYAEASPVNYVNKNSPPTLMFHGKLDLIVPVKQSQDLKVKLDQFQVPNQLKIYENQGHDLTGIDTDKEFLNTINSWLTAYLK
ncbi:MAG: alpha/beta hydrolase [Daejeonella sp.]